MHSLSAAHLRIIIVPVAVQLIKRDAYRKLLAEIRAEMERGIHKVEEFLERQRVLSYWVIGGKINRYLAAHEMPYGTVGRFYDELSADLKIHDRTLQQCEQFYRYFPKFKADPHLKWGHYRFLLTQPDADIRKQWIARIKEEQIPSDEVRLAFLPPVHIHEAAVKTPVRGSLYTYRILRAQDIDTFDVPWFVDIGFSARCEAPASSARLDNKYLYTSVKLKRGYRLKVVNTKAQELYTFAAKCRRLVDADTLIADVDQGFGVWTSQRLRLKGIDAPELTTIAGQQAKKWLEDELADSPVIVVKTYKSDNWDRYLVDVFYLPKQTDVKTIAAQGMWLNGRMVAAGLATPWSTKRRNSVFKE